MTSSASASWTVLVFSDDSRIRERVRSAVGRRPASDVGRVEYVEASTFDDVLRLVDGGGIDLCILDGEASPAGGLGISRQLKDEIDNCPPTLVILGRTADRWLATWARCDAVLFHPIDAVAAADTVAELLRGRARTPLRGR